MQRFFLTLIILLILSACGQRQVSNTLNNAQTFKIFFHPSFDEAAEIILTKVDTQQVINFLLLARELPDKLTDTFYSKRISITKEQFDNFDSLVIQKMKIKQPHQWTGCCDGMPVEYLLIQENDTSKLNFRSPDAKSGSSGYKITKAAIEQLGIFYKDSVISDYFNDIESYMDETIHHINWKDNRPINRLRKIEYSR
jgi:hypothetical protein